MSLVIFSLHKTFSRALVPVARSVVAGLACLLAMQSETQNAIANGDTRTLNLIHAHTNETISATFRVDGQYDQKTLDQLNWFLRDWRIDEPTKMDPRLFDLMWETYRESGSRSPILVQSAYRSPQTNAMLRRRSKAVAENSQHMAGKAMDIHYYDVPMSQIREIGMRLQRGGVGYYPSAGSPFVHLDVGSVRAWPRMSYDQLARLFPDGKTVHLPPNGHPLAKYEEARAEIESRGTGSAPTLAQVKSKGFFAFLFGGGEDEDEDMPVGKVRAGSSRQMASVQSNTRTISSNVPASVMAANDDSSAAYYLAESNRRMNVQTPVVAKPQMDLPRGDIFIGPAPSTAPTLAAIKPSPASGAASAAAPLVTASIAAPALPKYVDMPLPPQRPAELMSIVAASWVPLPPIRPPELMPQGLKKTSVTAALQTNEGLPDVIIKGAQANQDGLSKTANALAYAPENSGLAGLMVPKPSANVQVHQPAARQIGAKSKTEMTPAKMGTSDFRALISPVALVQHAPVAVAPGQASALKSGRQTLIFSNQIDVTTQFEKRMVNGLASGFAQR